MKAKLISAVLIFTALSRLFPGTYHWELKDAIEQAMSKNLLLMQRQIDLDLKKTANDRSWSLFLPDLTGNISLSKKIISNDLWTASGRIGVSLDLDGSLPYKFKNLRYMLEKELISYEQGRQMYLRDIKDFFYQILLVKERISLAKENMDLIQKQYDNAALRYESGLASDLDLMAFKVSLASSRPEILSLENDYASKLFQLKYLTGLSMDDQLELTGSISQPKDSDSFGNFSDSVQDTLELQKLKLENLILKNNRKIEDIRDRFPALSLNYSYSPKINQPFGDNFFSEKSWVDKTSLEFSLSLSLPLNLLVPASDVRVEREATDAQIKKNDLELEQVYYTTLMEFSRLTGKLAGVRETLDARILAAEYALESYDYTLDSYNNGGVDLIGLRRSEKDLQQSRLAVLTETYNYISTIFDLEYLLGIELIKE